MLYLIVGIVLGAAFPDFWRNLFFQTQQKVSSWYSKYQSSSSQTVDGTATHEPSTANSDR